MGTHYKGSRKEIDALNSYIKLIRAAESLNSKINLELSEFDLTESQFGVLDALLHLGPLKQKEIGKKILKSGGNITMVIDNLEKQDLVQRKRGEKDRRHFIVHLTARGKNRILEVLPHLITIIKKHFDILNEGEQKELQRLCKITGLQVRL
jgi:MarR family transcriptional regulator, 2-MHQ and catechol-resistance regulon repressor